MDIIDLLDSDISTLEYYRETFNPDLKYTDFNELGLRNDLRKVFSKCKSRARLGRGCYFLLKTYLKTLASQDIENRGYYFEMIDMCPDYYFENNTIELMNYGNKSIWSHGDKLIKVGSINLDTMEFEVIKPIFLEKPRKWVATKFI